MVIYGSVLRSDLWRYGGTICCAGDLIQDWQDSRQVPEPLDLDLNEKTITGHEMPYVSVAGLIPGVQLGSHYQFRYISMFAL